MATTADNGGSGRTTYIHLDGLAAKRTLWAVVYCRACVLDDRSELTCIERIETAPKAASRNSLSADQPWTGRVCVGQRDCSDNERKRDQAKKLPLPKGSIGEMSETSCLCSWQLQLVRIWKVVPI